MNSKLKHTIFGDATEGEQFWQYALLLCNFGALTCLIVMSTGGIGAAMMFPLVLAAVLVGNIVVAILLWASKLRAVLAFQPTLIVAGSLFGVVYLLMAILGGVGGFQNSKIEKENALLRANYPPVNYTLVNMGTQTISQNNDPNYASIQSFSQLLPFFQIEPRQAAKGGGYVYLDQRHTTNLYDRARWIDTNSLRQLDMCFVDPDRQDLCQYKMLPIRRLPTPKFDAYAKLRIAAGEQAATAGKEKLPTIQYVYYVYPDRVDVLAADFTWQETPFQYPSTPFRVINASESEVTQVRVDDFILPQNVPYPTRYVYEYVLNYYGALPREVKVSWISKAAPLSRLSAIIDIPAGVSPDGFVLTIHADHVRLRKDVATTSAENL